VLLDLRATRKKIASIDGWLVVVSEQRLEEFLRREHAEKRGIDRTCLLSVLLPDGGNNDDEKLHEFADYNTPDKLACQAEQRGTARRLVERLAGRQREVMILVALKGQKVSAAAEALGLSRASVRDYLDKARAKLMQMEELRELAETLPPSCRSQLPT
jgi:RNA polymerase sigma factor (sigma-70 family)